MKAAGGMDDMGMGDMGMGMDDDALMGGMDGFEDEF